MRTIAILIILLCPTWIETRKDRKGNKHPNHDWVYTLIFCIVTGCLVSFSIHQLDIEFMVRYSVASGFLFWAVFSYWNNLVELKNGTTTYAKIPKLHIYSYRLLTWKEVLDHVVNHLSGTAWPDKTKWWRAIGWFGRLVVYLVFLTVAILLVVL